MRLRRGWVGVWVVCLGVGTAAANDVAVTPAEAAWEQGQQAMGAGDAAGAIPWYERSLRLDPALACNHLSLAAAYVALGQEERALPHLERYVRERPDHVAVRAHYADLLFRLHRRGPARAEYERFVADAQDHDELARGQLVHCHSRLMEIAEAAEDHYAEHLNRGIGLYLLARQRAALPDPHGSLSVEELLCRAAAELTLARLEGPEEARPCWYLAEVWSALAQRQPAARWLRAAEEAAPFSYLTPAEKRGLYLACRRDPGAGARK